MKFDGSSGRKPHTEARRYVYQKLAESLEMDLDNGAEWMSEDNADGLTDMDLDHLQREARKVAEEMRRKSL